MNDNRQMISLVSTFSLAYHNTHSRDPVVRDDFVAGLFSQQENKQIEQYIAQACELFGFDPCPDGDEDSLSQVIDRQVLPLPVARARYFEDSLRTAAMSGTEQYVLLGCGFDTFAFRRCAFKEKLTIFEVDNARILDDKRRRLKRAGAVIAHNLKLVECEPLSDTLGDCLISAGFDTSKRTFFALPGMSYYMSEAELESLLMRIAELSAVGSSFCFDFADAGMSQAKQREAQNMYTMAAVRGSAITLMLDETLLSSLLERCGFLIYELLDSAAIDERYFSFRDDELTAIEHIGFALAVSRQAQYVGTKEKLITASLKLFSRKGYDAVSVKDIADELMITKGALYRHFSSKQEILDTIIERIDACKVPFARKVNGAAALMDYCEAFFRYWTKGSFTGSVRRLLTIEQYNSERAAKLFEKLFVDEPLCQLKQLANSIDSTADCEKKASQLYSLVFFSLHLADSEPGTALTWLRRQLSGYIDGLERKKRN